jgi:hypothetical protein
MPIDGMFYHPDLQDFLLPWASVGASPNPERTVIDFLEAAAFAAADLGAGDRQALERR